MEHNTFFQSASFEDILDDLSCRFIVNIPSEELVSVPRICFQIEQAHWFYEDFVREQNPHRLPSLSLRKFSKCIFDGCPLLWQYSGSHEEEFEDFLRYKQRVPVLGGILLDENWEQCILVKAWKGGSWSFPRGKINKDEPDTDCAIREVYEETGFDISPLILPDAFLELQIKEQRVKLYIIPGVPTNTPMSPQTRKEISMIRWIKLGDLPGYSSRNKQTHPGIRLYMVTPFLWGLRKWIRQNHHRKGNLVPVEKDILEEDEVVQNGTTDDLIAMLRRQQQPSTNHEVDLLAMLRNGSQPQYPTPPAQEHYYPPPPPSNGLLYPFQGNPTQSSDLLQFSPYISQVPDTIQEPSRPVEPQPPMLHQNLPDARRNGLLGILKGDPNLSSEPNVVNPSLLDILKGSQSPPVHTTQRQVVESANVDHQQSLLTTFKRPQLSSPKPATSSKPPTAHQNALLSALKSPSISHATPSPSQSPKAMPATSSAHQSALLATLKLPPKPTPPPSKESEVPSRKKSPVVQAATTSNHQNALLAALTSPNVQPSKPPTNHQSSLLIALKSSPVQTPSPKPATNGQPANSQPVPGSTTEIPVQTTAASLLLRVKSPPIARTTPSPAHQSSLLSALKSPILPPASSSTQHQSSLLNALKSPPIVQGQTSSAFENPKLESSMEKREVSVNKGTEAKNAHMESLLRTLKSPLASPVVEKVVPELHTDKPTKGGVMSDVAETEVAAIMSLKQSNTESVIDAKTPPVSNHVSSLLSSLKGSSAPLSAPPSKPAISTAQNSLLSALMGAKSSKPEVSKPSERAPEVISAISNQVTSTAVQTSPSSGIAQNPPPRSTKSPFDTPKDPRPNGTPPSNSPSPATTSHQKSLLSLLNPPTRQSPPPPSKPESNPSSSLKSQQFNFSPNPQIGKRIKFRESLPPGGKKEVTPEPPSTEPKSNGNIDLSKMTLLKRTATTEKSVTSKNTPTMDDKPTIPTETERPVIDTMPLKGSVENKPEGPLGIEFPFRKRTPSKNSRASPTPTTTPTQANTQSLLALLKIPTPQVTEGRLNDTSGQLGTKNEHTNSLLDVLKPTPKEESQEPAPALEENERSTPLEETFPGGQPEEVESLGPERELKLIAMLERALARGVPS